MLNTPFSPWPNFTEEEANAARDVILSNKVNYWTGKECRQFEQEFAAWAETDYAVALANGTVALDSALNRSDAWWALYNGLISYIAMGLMFAGEYAVRLWVRRNQR